MRHSILYIFFIISFIQNVSSQNAQIEIEKAFNKAISNHYSNKDSAYYYYEKTISLADEQNNLEYLLSSLLYLINVNGYYYDLKNYNVNLQREDSLLRYDKRFDTLTSLQYYKDYLLFDKGNYNYKIKQYSTSKKYFQELYTKINTIPKKNRTKANIAMLSSIHSFLGLIYRHTGKYELATYTFNKDITLLSKYKDSVDNWESRIFNSKKLLSQVFEEKKEFAKANVLLKEVLIFYKTKVNNPRFKNNILSTYILLVKNEIKQGKFKQAIETLNENSQLYIDDNPFAKEVDLLYGDTYLGLENYKKSITYYNKSLLKTIAYRNDKKHQDVATIYARIGKSFMQEQKFDKGLQHYQMALIQLEKDFNNTSLNTNPNPKKVVSKTVLITILKEKLDALFNSYKITNDLNYLNKAHNTSKTIINTLDVLRPEFESKLDKQFLITETYPSIQKMVTIAYQLYQNTEDKTFIADAFFFMEKSKSILLLEAYRNSEATKYGGVPEFIISKEQQFRAKISHLEQEIFKSRLLDTQSLTDTLFSVKNNYNSYLDNIEKEYPNYFALKYKSTVASLQTTQQQLYKNQAVLSYLVTEDALYLTLIDSKKTGFYKLPFDKKIKNTIRKLYRKSSKLNIQDASIYKDSYIVYQSILEPVLQKINATDLIILADDILNYIPFDALVTSNKKRIYLLSTHSISYASSATLLQAHNKIGARKNSNLLIFAPQFNGTSTTQNQERTDMAPLLYNEQEAENIAQYFNGKIYGRNNASINNFKNELGKYNLIHFATHASANDEFPDYSYLAFSHNDSIISNLLYVKDLYNYKINADLVTLSACQTGIGKLQKGEGMLSLARAFNYAGVPAIVTTLWKINDQSTSEIMKYFYKNLNDGLSKKEALRQAKLTYIETNDDPLLNHPYYWSGIVLTGNTMPINSTNYLFWILLGVIGIVIIGLVTKKFIPKKK